MDILTPQNPIPLPEEVANEVQKANDQVIIWQNEVTSLKRAKLAEQSEIEALIGQHKQVCDNIDLVNTSIASLTDQQDSLTQQVASLTVNVNDLTTQKTVLEQSLSDTQTAVDSAKSDLAANQTAIVQINMDAAKQKEDLDAREAKIASAEKVLQEAITSLNS